jgi:hypothetical protein
MAAANRDIISDGKKKRIKKWGGSNLGCFSRLQILHKKNEHLFINNRFRFERMDNILWMQKTIRNLWKEVKEWFKENWPLLFMIALLFWFCVLVTVFTIPAECLFWGENCPPVSNTTGVVKI